MGTSHDVPRVNGIQLGSSPSHPLADAVGASVNGKGHSMTIHISEIDVRSGLEALVAEKGEDFVYGKNAQEGPDYPVCLYVRNGEPDCIVGQFLARQGVPIERLMEADKTFGGTPARDLLQELVNEDVISISDDSIYALREAQYNQDTRLTWGESVTLAVRMLSV